MGDINEMLQQIFLLILFAGSVMGFLVGFLLLFQPEALIRLNQYLSRWISVKWAREWLERPHYIEKSIHRHNGILCGILLAYTAVGLYAFLSTRITWADIQSAEGMMPAMLTTLFLFSLALAAMVGLALLLNPKALYNLEDVANHWTSSNNVLEWFEEERPPIDQHILRHRFIAGLLITAGSLYVLIAVGYFLTAGNLL
jgi:hypothetical protein